jgi:hypothetical protein
MLQYHEFEANTRLEKVYPMAANRQETKQTGASGQGVAANLARHSGLSYLELPSVDVRRSAAFYAKVVGWNVEGLETDQRRVE